MQSILRLIPKANDFLEDQDIVLQSREITHSRLMEYIRTATDSVRKKIINDYKKIPLSDENTKDTTSQNDLKSRLYKDIKDLVLHEISDFEQESLKKVINATGVVIHTNLGRSPLPTAAAHKAYEIATNYNNLEYSTLKGKRENRMRYIEQLITDLTGAEAALVVNNNAAAVLLTLNTFAKDKEVLLSRGEMVEIGDSFRISEIIELSGCNVKEIGTTNKTKLRDYKDHITVDTKVLLKVHTSNFKIVGFTESVSSEELVKIKGDCLVIEDMGSGILFDLHAYGFPKTRQVRDAIQEGVDLVTFSGDKMLAGPQGGIIAGRKDLIDKLKKNQLLRCLRMDKMCLAALEGTLRQYVKKDLMMNLPTVKHLTMSADVVLTKSHKLVTILKDSNPTLILEIKEFKSQVGGGSLPGETMDCWGIYIKSDAASANAMEEYLRHQPTPIVGVIQKDELILNVRCIEECDFPYIGQVFQKLNES